VDDSSTNSQNKQEKINQMKETLNNFFDKVISNQPNDSGASTTLKTDTVSVQFGSTANLDEINKNARENNLAIVNNTACETLLKQFYNIPSNLSLIISKFDFSSDTDLSKMNDTDASKLISFNYYSPINKTQKLNINVCSATPIKTNIPLKNPARINNYVLKTINVDIFNPNETAFVSRCKANIDKFDNESDTTVNKRRKNYFNGTGTCSEGCDYKGLDESNFMICDCKGVSNKEISQSINNKALDQLSKLNYNVALCWDKIREYVI
jgi:hypothetical protein